MPASETGKQRSARIPLDYYKRAGRIDRWKLVGAAITAAVAGAWAASALLFGRQTASLCSPGKVAGVHAMWETQCSACHAAFRPIRSDAWPATWKAGTQAADQKCEACHLPPPHHANVLLAQGPSCSTCHREHQGASMSLLRMDDAACTTCHREIDLHTGGKSSLEPAVARVTRFDTDHPVFRSARIDPGRLKFSHWRHLMPGMRKAPDDKTPPWTLAQITDPAERERYRRANQANDSPVQLDCSSCHRLERSGAYMLPINFETQCRACHPLAIEPGSTATIPHRQPPQKTQQMLRDRYADEFLQADPSLLERFVPDHPMPGVSSIPEQSKTAELIDHRVATAERWLGQAVCGKCHYSKLPDAAGLAAIVPPNLPEIWLKHAKFNHERHREIDCRECHARAFPDDPHASRLANDVLIPPRDACVVCHGPQRETAGDPQGGARFDCAECHAYHNRNQASP